MVIQSGSDESIWARRSFRPVFLAVSACLGFIVVLLVAWGMGSPPRANDRSASGLVAEATELLTQVDDSLYSEAVSFDQVREFHQRSEIPDGVEGEVSHVVESNRLDMAEKHELLRTLFENPKAVEAEMLFLYSDVNPEKAASSPGQLVGFRALHHSCVKPLQEMLTLLPRLQRQELDDFASRGLLRPLTLSTSEEVQKKVREAKAMNARAGIATEPMFRGSNFYVDAEGLELFCRIDGVVFGASRRDLPQSTKRWSVYSEAVVDTYLKIVVFANLSGLLDGESLGDRILKAEEWRDSQAGV